MGVRTVVGRRSQRGFNMNEYYTTCKKCQKKFKVQDWKQGEELDTCFTCLVIIRAYKEMIKNASSK